MKLKLCSLLSLFVFLAVACQPAAPACPPESITHLQEENPSLSTSANDSSPTAEQLVEINGQEVLVTQVVQGILCSGRWSGTVYVPCALQVFAWDDDPNFLENCDLIIEPGTIVYVAAHNDEPYYQGCSCHSGESSE